MISKILLGIKDSDASTLNVEKFSMDENKVTIVQDTVNKTVLSHYGSTSIYNSDIFIGISFWRETNIFILYSVCVDRSFGHPGETIIVLRRDG